VRLFVAVELTDEVIRAASDLIDELRARAKRLAPRARITWVVPARLHVTLAFIGAVDDDRAAAIVEALRPSWALASFQIVVEDAGAFPPRGLPRALWAGIGTGRDALVELQREVAARLARVGVPPESRPFHPHVTLARVRVPAGLRTALLLDGLTGTRLGAFEVGAVTLMESRLSPKGSEYVPLHRAELDRGGDRPSSGPAPAAGSRRI
jgi:2'-5' RNA ligase